MKSDDLTRAAISWWKSKRPNDYTAKDHVKNWQVNTFNNAEKNLAKAVAAIVKERSAK